MEHILAKLCSLLRVPAIIKQYVKDQISYFCFSESILNRLRDKVQLLKESANNLQLDVNAARQNLETIRPEVEDWLRRAAEIKEQTENFLQNIPAEVQEGGINGICSNLKLHYSVSRDAMMMAEAVDSLGNGKFERVVAHPALPPGREIIPYTSGTEFKSRKTKEEEIMAALRDNSVYMIGICGMGGVGKTTMAEKIWKRAKEKELLDVVAMAVVSQQLDKKGIQKQIAKYMGLELKEDETVSMRARRLRTRLMQEKSILVIIDDIWEKMNLEELGIPSQSDHKGCKIILTSRNRDVCSQMEAMLRHVYTEIEDTETERKRIFSLECLGEEEAWDLLRANAGTCVDDRDLHQIANEVAKECKGLPLALVTVGCALANKRAKHVWKDALVQLRRSAPSHIRGFLKDVYQPLELSYKQLDNEEIRYLFLLCCLFPEDSRIFLKDLLHYGVGLRIFSNIETLSEARNRVYRLVEILESRYMLIDDGTDEGIKYVRMHDLIRDMAKSIASTGEHVFMTSHGLEDWPRKDSYENYTCISLTVKGRTALLPECINCPRLEMLRIKSGWEGQIPDMFFYRMRKLNVLDIGHIRLLPSSLQFLTNLRTLRLRKSKMKIVSMIGQLVKLEILDLSYSHLEVLPKEIGGLDNLKSLDLSQCSQLREIAPGVISRLVRLEELFMLYSFQNWEAEVEGKERRNASLVEVASLKNLTAVQLEIPDPEVLPQDTINWTKLESFEIWIGTSPLTGKKRDDYGENNLILILNQTTPWVRAITGKAHCLKIKLGGMSASDEVIKGIQEGNQHLKSLSLNGCSNIKYLSKENIVFPKLKSLYLSNCVDLEMIFFGGLLLAGSFDALKELKLEDLCKLTHLWNQKLCLPNLSQAIIRKCSSLKYLFLQSVAESLSQLQILEIEECQELKEVFKAEREGSENVVGPIVFTSLTKLKLKELPSLNSFCKAVKGIGFPLLRTLRIKSVDNLKVFCPMEESCFFGNAEHNSDSEFFFHQKVTFASLEKLELYNIKTATKIFSSQIPMVSFCRLKYLTVACCPNLKFIFSPPTAFKNFGKLYKLNVTNCSKLEEVIGKEEVVRKEDEEVQATPVEPLFPELQNLVLKILPNFRSFCHMMKNDVKLPQLEKVTVVDCHQTGSFSLGSLILPSLAYVYGLLDPDLATQIFFNKQIPRHEIHCKNNSFTLSAQDLSICDSQVSDYWERCLAKVSSDNFIVVARLLGIKRSEISGKFEMVKLLPETLYEVVFELKLDESHFYCGVRVSLKLAQSEGTTQDRLEDLEHQARGEWIEILAGEFTTGPNPIGDLEFSLYHHETGSKRGLLIKGVTIRPKT